MFKDWTIDRTLHLIWFLVEQKYYDYSTGHLYDYSLAHQYQMRAQIILSWDGDSFASEGWDCVPKKYHVTETSSCVPLADSIPLSDRWQPWAASLWFSSLNSRALCQKYRKLMSPQCQCHLADIASQVDLRMRPCWNLFRSIVLRLLTCEFVWCKMLKVI